MTAHEFLFQDAIVSAINQTPFTHFVPVVEGPGGFLPDLPSRLIRSGHFHAVDFIGGHCTGDGKTFATAFSGAKPEQFMTDDDIRTLLFPALWPNVVRVVLIGLCVYRYTDWFLFSVCSPMERSTRHWPCILLRVRKVVLSRHSGIALGQWPEKFFSLACLYILLATLIFI